MTTTADNPIQVFQDAVNQLYKNIENWAKALRLQLSWDEIQIEEGDLGPYTIHRLLIHDENNGKIAELNPIGCRIIGAEGRVDLFGTFDRQILVYLEYPGPSISITTDEEKKKSSMFSNVNQTGWYWIESKIRGKAHVIKQELFMELLSMVSDYEYDSKT